MIDVLEAASPKTRTAPQPDTALREALFEHFLHVKTSTQLSKWLKDLNQDQSGTLEQKRSRLHATSKYPCTPAGEFPDRTRAQLDDMQSEQLADVCSVLGLDTIGTKTARYLRILREVGYREGWLTKPPTQIGPDFFTMDNVLPFVRWHQVVKTEKTEDAYYRPFYEDMADAFGEEWVHEQFPMGQGVGRKIDFHLGHLQRGGIGIEFKMPRSSTDIDRALGQIDSYRTIYEERLLVVLLPDHLDAAKQGHFIAQLEAKRIRVMVKW
ncbi:MAG: hypothetical protein ACKVQA_18640 [Burkholderiales bacterium]